MATKKLQPKKENKYIQDVTKEYAGRGFQILSASKPKSTNTKDLNKK